MNKTNSETYSKINDKNKDNSGNSNGNKCDNKGNNNNKSNNIRIQSNNSLINLSKNVILIPLNQDNLNNFNRSTFLDKKQPNSSTETSNKNSQSNHLINNYSDNLINDQLNNSTNFNSNNSTNNHFDNLINDQPNNLISNQQNNSTNIDSNNLINGQLNNLINFSSNNLINDQLNDSTNINQQDINSIYSLLNHESISQLNKSTNNQSIDLSNGLIYNVQQNYIPNRSQIQINNQLINDLNELENGFKYFDDHFTSKDDNLQNLANYYENSTDMNQQLAIELINKFNSMKVKLKSLEKYINQNYNLDKKIDKSIQTEPNILIDPLNEIINEEDISEILANFSEEDQNNFLSNDLFNNLTPNNLEPNEKTSNNFVEYDPKEKELINKYLEKERELHRKSKIEFQNLVKNHLNDFIDKKLKCKSKNSIDKNDDNLEINKQDLIENKIDNKINQTNNLSNQQVENFELLENEHQNNFNSNDEFIIEIENNKNSQFELNISDNSDDMIKIDDQFSINSLELKSDDMIKVTDDQHSIENSEFKFDDNEITDDNEKNLESKSSDNNNNMIVDDINSIKNVDSDDSEITDDYEKNLTKSSELDFDLITDGNDQHSIENLESLNEHLAIPKEIELVNNNFIQPKQSLLMTKKYILKSILFIDSSLIDEIFKYDRINSIGKLIRIEIKKFSSENQSSVKPLFEGSKLFLTVKRLNFLTNCLSIEDYVSKVLTAVCSVEDIYRRNLNELKDNKDDELNDNKDDNINDNKDDNINDNNDDELNDNQLLNVKNLNKPNKPFSKLIINEIYSSIEYYCGLKTNTEFYRPIVNIAIEKKLKVLNSFFKNLIINNIELTIDQIDFRFYSKYKNDPKLFLELDKKLESDKYLDDKLCDYATVCDEIKEEKQFKSKYYIDFDYSNYEN